MRFARALALGVGMILMLSVAPARADCPLCELILREVQRVRDDLEQRKDATVQLVIDSWREKKDLVGSISQDGGGVPEQSITLGPFGGEGPAPDEKPRCELHPQTPYLETFVPLLSVGFIHGFASLSCPGSAANTKSVLIEACLESWPHYGVCDEGTEAENARTQANYVDVDATSELCHERFPVPIHTHSSGGGVWDDSAGHWAWVGQKDSNSAWITCDVLVTLLSLVP